MALIEFAAWRPDLAELNTGVATVATGVFPAEIGYTPAPRIAAFSSALAADGLSGFTAIWSGSPVIFAGTATKLYQLNTADLTWTDVSRTVGGNYSASDDERWQFAQFGQYVVAVNVNDAPQVFDLNGGTNFAALAGSPPQARTVAVWGNFLVLGGLEDFPSRVHWSAFDDITGWTPGTNNSDINEFPDGGPIKGLSSSENPIIVQETAIRRGAFAPGTAEVFIFDKIMDRIGARSRYSVCSRDNIVFFVSDDGFYSVTYDGQLSRIGFQAVDNTILDAVSDIANIQGAVDPSTARVYFAYATASAAVGTFDKIAVFDFRLNKWSQLDETVRWLFPAATTGYSLDALGLLGYTLENLPFSLDSRVWAGGVPLLAAITTDDTVAYFNGGNAEATIETGDVGGLTLQVVTAAMPLVDATTTYVTLGKRLKHGDTVTWGTETATSTNTGIARFRSRGRFHRARLRIPAATIWDHAQGLDVIGTNAGTR
jgi:hypothetical protein